MVRGDRLAMVLEGHGLLVDGLKEKTKRQEGAEPKISEKVGREGSQGDGRSEMGGFVNVNVKVKVVVSDYRQQAAGYRGRRSTISQTPSPFPARRAGKVGGAGFEPAKA